MLDQILASFTVEGFKRFIPFAPSVWSFIQTRFFGEKLKISFFIERSINFEDSKVNYLVYCSLLNKGSEAIVVREVLFLANNTNLKSWGVCRFYEFRPMKSQGNFILLPNKKEIFSCMYSETWTNSLIQEYVSGQTRLVTKLPKRIERSRSAFAFMIGTFEREYIKKIQFFDVNKSFQFPFYYRKQRFLNLIRDIKEQLRKNIQ